MVVTGLQSRRSTEDQRLAKVGTTTIVEDVLIAAWLTARNHTSATAPQSTCCHLDANRYDWRTAYSRRRTAASTRPKAPAEEPKPTKV